MITSIETAYNGLLFRSRTEARYAVFFDALGVPYAYEPEGFDLSVDGWYLPDFWLPAHRVWLEVRGLLPSPDERRKAEALAARSQACVLMGSPVFTSSPRPTVLGGEVTTGERGWHLFLWTVCDHGLPGIVLGLLDKTGLVAVEQTICRTDVHAMTRGHVQHPALWRAYHVARRARFEHGETPQFAAAP
jgi:hypothetical protein